MPAYIGYHLAILAGLAFAETPLSEPGEVSARLDTAIEAKWVDRGITAEQPADDATFLRRVWLDLTGHVPSALVAREFRDDSRSDKRTRMVDQLLASDDFANYWARAWTIRLTEQRPIRQAMYDGTVLQAYLRESLQSGKSYQRIAQELVTAEGARDSSGPANYLLRYGAKPEALAGAVGKNFLGATLQCAQCHDHVFAHWKQDDFRGLAAFFSRLKLMTSEDGGLHAIVESRRGEYQYVEPGAKPGPDGNIPMQTVAPRLPVAGTAPLPALRPRRQELAAWLTSPENPWFTRHAVNSVWQDLFGAPLVPSLDEPAAAAGAPHADLLELLCHDFVAAGYDLKRLIRIVVLSRAYQRAPVVQSPVVQSPVVQSPVVQSPVVQSPVVQSPVVQSPVVQSPVVQSPVVQSPVAQSPVVQSPVVQSPVVQSPVAESPATESPGAGSDPTQAERLQAFAVFPIRPLTVDQLYFSINQATGNRSIEEAVVENSGEETPEAQAQAEARAFSDRPIEALGGHGVGMQRALVLLNSPFMYEALQSGVRIAATMHGPRIDRPHVEWLFLATLSRPPEADELQRMLELVRAEQGTRGLEDVLWVLLNSAEFNSNH